MSTILLYIAFPNNISALALICVAFGISWPVRSFLYLDMFNIYLDVIRWKDLLDQELNTFAELKLLCSTMLEWRLAIYSMAFQIFCGCILFRCGVIPLPWAILFSSYFRFFLIKWADRGLVVKGRLNTGLFNVRCRIVLLSLYSSYTTARPINPPHKWSSKGWPEKTWCWVGRVGVARWLVQPFTYSLQTQVEVKLSCDNLFLPDALLDPEHLHGCLCHWKLSLQLQAFTRLSLQQPEGPCLCRGGNSPLNNHG